MTKALHIKNLTKTYSNGLKALKDISIDIEQGDFFALLGPNGAGKSTTIGIISSLVKKTSGHVSIYGIDIDKNFIKAKTYLGIVPQEFNFNTFEPVNEIIINQAGYYGIPTENSKAYCDELLIKLGLSEKRNQVARNLSGGMKRRLMIARALIHRPKLLILDEPTAGADIEVRRLMWDYLKEINDNGTTIILTTHYLEEAENLCNKIAIIDNGEIIENNSMNEFLKQLKNEDYILYTKDDIGSMPNIEGYKLAKLSSNSLEATINEGQNINTLLNKLTDVGLSIASLKNKRSRLEELFVRLLEKGGEENE